MICFVIYHLSFHLQLPFIYTYLQVYFKTYIKNSLNSRFSAIVIFPAVAETIKRKFVWSVKALTQFLFDEDTWLLLKFDFEKKLLDNIVSFAKLRNIQAKSMISSSEKNLSLFFLFIRWPVWFYTFYVQWLKCSKSTDTDWTILLFWLKRSTVQHDCAS